MSKCPLESPDPGLFACFKWVPKKWRGKVKMSQMCSNRKVLIWNWEKRTYSGSDTFTSGTTNYEQKDRQS